MKEFKICSKCHKKKSLDDFSKRSACEDGLQKQCKKCMSSYANVRYRRDGVWKKQIYDSNVKRRADARRFVRKYLSDHPCVVCGESDVVVLDFHHVSGTKETEICTMVGLGYSLKTIEAEIAKCVVMCANCHRREHAKSRTS